MSKAPLSFSEILDVEAIISGEPETAIGLLLELPEGGDIAVRQHFPFNSRKNKQSQSRCGNISAIHQVINHATAGRSYHSGHT